MLKINFYVMDSGKFRLFSSVSGEPQTTITHVHWGTDSKSILTGDLGESILYTNLRTDSDLRKVFEDYIGESIKDVKFLGHNEIKDKGIRVDDLIIETESGKKYVMEAKTTSQESSSYFREANLKALEQIKSTLEKNPDIDGAFLADINLEKGKVDIFKIEKDIMEREMYDVYKEQFQNMDFKSEYNEYFSDTISDINERIEIDFEDIFKDVKTKDITEL